MKTIILERATTAYKGGLLLSPYAPHEALKVKGVALSHSGRLTLVRFKTAWVPVNEYFQVPSGVEFDKRRLRWHLLKTDTEVTLVAPNESGGGGE